MLDRILGLPFWIAAYIQQHRMRLEQLRQQDRAYRAACAEAARSQAQRRMQLQADEGQYQGQD